MLSLFGSVLKTVPGDDGSSVSFAGFLLKEGLQINIFRPWGEKDKYFNSLFLGAQTSLKIAACYKMYFSFVFFVESLAQATKNISFSG